MPNYNNGLYQQVDPLQYYYQPTTTGVPSSQYYQNRYLQQPYQAQTPTPPYQQNNQIANNGSMIWVQGEAGAKAFSNLQPGIPVALWDSEEQVIYIKSIDQSGKPTMTILDYTDRNAADKQEVVHDEYITKEQFDSLIDQINDMDEHISNIEDKIANANKQQQNQNQNNRRSNK